MSHVAIDDVIFQNGAQLLVKFWTKKANFPLVYTVVEFL